MIGVVITTRLFEPPPVFYSILSFQHEKSFTMMMTPQYEKGKLYDIPIIDLRPDPNQPRKSLDPQAIEELVASIRTFGVIQPILFRVDGGQISNPT
jgi:hypothetical protein